MDVTTFHEGETVSYVGTEMPPAHGRLVTFASKDMAYVSWLNGARQGQMEMVDLYDLAPITAAETLALTNPNGPQVVRQAFASNGEAGVVNFLVTAKHTGAWAEIAADAFEYVVGRLRADSSLDMAYEQLTPEQADSVTVTAARTILRDAFGDWSAA